MDTRYPFRISFSIDGKRYWVRGKTQEEAIRKEAQKRDEVMSGIVTNNSSVKQWARVWFDTYIAPKDITEASRAMYVSKLNNEILPAIGSYRLRTITPVQLQGLLNKCQGGSTSNTSKLRIVIKAMFRQAFQNRIIPFDPAAGLQMPRTVTGKHRSITDQERAALIRVADMEKFDGRENMSGTWVLSMLYCGLRPGETAALKWEDIDLENGTMHIKRAKEAHSTTIKAPKTEAGIRTIPIPRCYVARLEALPHTGEYVFPQRDGKTPLSDSSIKRRWETIKKYMDLEMGASTTRIKPKGKRKSTLVITEHALADDLDLYCLRHTYCTDLQAAGVPINIAKELMGHSSISVTANIYTHATTQSVEIARNLIDTLR